MKPALIVCGLILVFIVLGMVANGVLYTVRVERGWPANGRIVTVNGVGIHVLQSGEKGPVIMMLHGASANAREFAWTLAPRLAGAYRVLMPDRPGHGYSSRSARAETLGVQAAQIDGILARLAPDDRVVVVGHSFGAAVALRLALDYPERIGGLVLLAPVSHDWGGGGEAWYNACAGNPFIGRVFSLLAPIFGPRQAKKGIDAVFWPQPVPENYYRKSAISLLFRPHAFRANALAVNALRQELVTQQDHYPDIRIPVIVYSGKRDTVLDPALHAERLEDRIADLHLIQLPGTGHMPHHAHGEAIARKIARLADAVNRKNQARSAMASR